jgi:hypothetical protein
MPVVLRTGGYRFFFYAGDRDEPHHIHVRRDALEAKFWLHPVGLAWNRGFPVHELGRIQKLVRAHARELMAAWHEYHDPDIG